MGKDPAPPSRPPATVEPIPAARRHETQKTLGALARQAVSLARPAAAHKTSQKLDAASVGLRQAPKTQKTDGDTPPTAPVADAEKDQAAQRRQSARDEHQQRVWDKLGTAKRSAEAKQARLKAFQPQRADAAAEDDDFEL